jgi:hypothetical protein
VRRRAAALALVGAVALGGCGDGGGGGSKPAKPPPAKAPAAARAPGPGARALEAAARGDRVLHAMTCEALEQGNDYFDIRSRHLDEAGFVAKYQPKYEPRYGAAARPAAVRTFSLLRALEERDMDRLSLDLRCLNTAAPPQ